MRNRLAWLAGAVGAAGVAYRSLKRRRRPAATSDPRADELRQRLDESRSVVDEREEFESGETRVDEVAEASVDQKRAAAHARGRAAADEMRPKADS
jgi:hypothetical protein